jgi:hypothetical protein
MTSHVYIAINLFNLCQHFFLPFYTYFSKCWHRLNEPSEQKTKQVNIYSLFVREYITRISQVQKLQNSKLLAKIRKNIEM